MPTAPNTSFIPKRGPATQSRRSVSRHIHVFTVLSYLFFSATLVATIGVFFYNDYIDKLRQQEISTLNAAISSFDEAEMKRILAFDSRLQQAQGRIENSVSSVSILEALEAATVQTVQLENLIWDRELDNKFTLTATVNTDSFDSTLFQRGVFERNEVIESIEVNELAVVVPGEDDTTTKEGVTFTAVIGVPVKSVLYTPEDSVFVPPPAAVLSEEGTTTVPEVSADANQETL